MDTTYKNFRQRRECMMLQELAPSVYIVKDTQATDLSLSVDPCKCHTFSVCALLCMYMYIVHNVTYVHKYVNIRHIYFSAVESVHCILSKVC